MTQKELANRINKNKIHINQVINRGSCNYDTAISIANGLGVSIDEILEDKEM
ncbi:MAG: helix-turn-helix transcriptional regulator [Finegoldia magna]|nr:helix-turn-helix transcriptional regulator [Finegoldia magna]